ncbi:hypothetical protein SOASR030_24500 [Leminorella grimontii]|uniref:Transposase n=1 Tax=Leminorella grimontii TaxID=82981 RepID=A0AAV5N2M4_9GAMM|nr:hypothetical protein SOASR030_24500 [Leminorella grimontii]
MYNYSNRSLSVDQHKLVVIVEFYFAVFSQTDYIKENAYANVSRTRRLEARTVRLKSKNAGGKNPGEPAVD